MKIPSHFLNDAYYNNSEKATSSNYTQPANVGLTWLEFADRVQSFLSVSCMLPNMITNEEIKRIVETQVLPWFRRKYPYATERTYYYIPKTSFKNSPDDGPNYSGALYVYLPKDVLAVVYSPYVASQRRLFSIGTNPAIMNVEIGLNQAYTPSFLTTLGDFGIYRLVLDGFSDAINDLRKHTVKYDFNPHSKRLMILSSIPDGGYGVVVEVEAFVPCEFLYENDLFYKMTVGYALISASIMGSRFDIPLPGDAKLNVADLRTMGEGMIGKVEEEVNKITNSSFFFLVRR